MPNPIHKAFTTHPGTVGESYGEHFGHAMSYSSRLAKASFCAFVHAIFPFWFEKTASTMIREMVREMDARQSAPAGRIAPGASPAE